MIEVQFIKRVKEVQFIKVEVEVQFIKVEVEVDTCADDRCDPPYPHQVPRGSDSWRTRRVSCSCDSFDYEEIEEREAA